MIHYWDITIPELTGDETRRAYVYLPESYVKAQEDKNVEPRRYPVLYMFDGHNVFYDDHATYGKSWGMKEFMDETKTELIIVAVECNHGMHYDRLKEYTPYTFVDPKVGKIKAKGDIYMKWMVNTLKPFIDEHLPTLPDRENTMIAGSSMGGLMSLYAVVKYNHIFGKAACLSPSVPFVKNKMINLIHNTELDPETVIYVDYGSEEMNYKKQIRAVATKLLSTLMYKNINLQCRVIPHGNHSEASWEKQIPFFMEVLMYDPRF